MLLSIFYTNSVKFINNNGVRLMKTFNVSKRIIATFATLLCSSLITFNATAATPSQQPSNSIITEAIEISPKIDTNVTKTLTTSSFSNIVSDNNWLKAKVYVTLEDTSKVDEVILYVSSTDGSDILAEKNLKKGYSLSFTVPYNSGSWILHAKAVGSGGSATFHIQD